MADEIERDKHALPDGEAEAKLNRYPETKTQRGRGRLPGFRMSDHHRSKIQKSQILNYLISHAEGKRKMSATQAAVGLGLLKKVLPDLSRQEQTGIDGGPIHHAVSVIERRIVDPKAAE